MAECTAALGARVSPEPQNGPGWERRTRSPRPACLRQHTAQPAVPPFLNGFGHGHSTASLGNLFPCSAICTVKKFFLIFL